MNSDKENQAVRATTSTGSWNDSFVC